MVPPAGGDDRFAHGFEMDGIDVGEAGVERRRLGVDVLAGEGEAVALVDGSLIVPDVGDVFAEAALLF